MSPEEPTGRAADEPVTILGLEQELAVVVACGVLAVASLAALPSAGDYRLGTMLVAVALFGVFGALGAFGLYSVR